MADALSVSVSFILPILPSTFVALLINQPFIKQKELPALPKSCIDNIDIKTEHLPSLPSTPADHSAW